MCSCVQVTRIGISIGSAYDGERSDTVAMQVALRAKRRMLPLTIILGKLKFAEGAPGIRLSPICVH